MKARIFAGLVAAVALLAGSAAQANHPQGCNPLVPGTPIVIDVLGHCPETPQDDFPLELSGCAYGAYADVTNPLTGANAVLNNTAPVNFVGYGLTSAAPALSAPCPIWWGAMTDGNFVASASLPLGPSPVGASAGTMETTLDAQAGWYPSGGYSLSSAETERVAVTFPLGSLSITADVVRAVAYCTAQAKGPGRDDIGPAGFGPATLVNLTITQPSLPGGQIVINQLPPEDTWIPIPGLGGIMLRETWDLEVPPYPMNPYKSFTENMIHVYFFGNPLLAGDVVVSHAHCDGYRLEGQPERSDPGPGR